MSGKALMANLNQSRAETTHTHVALCSLSIHVLALRDTHTRRKIKAPPPVATQGEHNCRDEHCIWSVLIRSGRKNHLTSNTYSTQILKHAPPKRGKNIYSYTCRDICSLHTLKPVHSRCLRRENMQVKFTGVFNWRSVTAELQLRCLECLCRR